MDLEAKSLIVCLVSAYLLLVDNLSVEMNISSEKCGMEYSVILMLNRFQLGTTSFV